MTELTPVKVREIRELHRNGCTLTAIAAGLRLSKSTVSKYIHGIKRSKPWGRRVCSSS